MRITTDEQGMLLEYGAVSLRVQPWGPDGIRVTMTAEAEPDRNDWALTETPAECSWAIAVGVPAKIVGYRCPDHLIDRLACIRWWDFPIGILKDHMDLILNKDISEESIDCLEKIREGLRTEE